MRFSLLVLTLAYASPVLADTTTDATNYARLRDRLRRFVDTGEGSGQSIPAHIRGDAEGYIRWADATIDLGWYIGVLATELHMRSRPSRFPAFVPGRTPEAIADELYLALGALERLDRVADASFECSSRESINGFFIRDDVPAGFHARFGLSETRSDFLDPITTNKEMSQDQVWHLMIGLSLTAKLVDANARGRDLSAWAVEQATRIIEHVADMSWRITNPACGDRAVARGDAAIGNRPGASRMIEFITDGALRYEVGASQQRLFDTLSDPDNALYTNVDNQHMAMAVAAIGEGFGAETIDHLVVLAETHDWWAYPLLYAALREDGDAPRWCLYRERVASEATTMLGEIGDAVPSSPRPGRAAHSFTSSNRFVRGSAEAYVGPGGSEGRHYHGLDFLLLHNLRAIAAPRTWAGGDAPEPGRCAPPVVDPDAGPSDPDAGASEDAAISMDSGSVADAGTDSPSEEGGGGCSTAGGVGGAWLMLLALVRRRRFG